MAYQVLARQWRPKTFASLRGQEQVTRALTNALARQQVHHAYLFTGTRGVGKTTIARILAKALNCEKGITPEPCGQCSACVDIDNGRFVDLIEVDGASRTRVEDTRELLDNVQYAPTIGRFKIYLIDEVHMLSGHSFNALLKTLEEPPAHVKFILATTDPEKIPVTVLSRCLRLSLKAISVGDIAAQLQEILVKQNISYEPNAVARIARLGQGSMRDAISLLEQAIAYCQQDLTAQAVDELFGLSYYRYLPTLLQGLASADIKQCLAVVDEMSMLGVDYEKILSSLLQSLHAIALAQALPTEIASIASIAEIDEATLAIKDQLGEEAVQLMYQIGLAGQKDLHFAPSMRTGFEMTLLRMMLFKPKAAQQQKREPLHAAIPAKAPASSQAATTPQAPVAPQEPIPPLKAAPVVAPATIDWVELCAKLPLSGLSRMLVKHCVLQNWDAQNKVMTLILEEEQKTLLSAQRQTQIQDALKSYFASEVKLAINIGVIEGTTPMMQEQAEVVTRQETATRNAQEDPIVQSLVSNFDANIEDIKAV